MPLLTRNQLLLAKIETNEGVDAAPINTDAIHCSLVDFTFDPQMLARPVVNRSLAVAKKEFGRKMIKFSFTCELKGSGTAGTAPQIGKLLQACAYKETLVALTSASYAPSSTATDHKTLTMWFYIDGKVYKAVACKGTFTVDLKAGMIPEIKFDFTGKFTAQADATMLALPTFEATTPIVMASGGMSFASFSTAVIRSLSINAGNQVTERLDVNSTEGLKGMAISQRDPTWTSLFEAELEATKAFWTDYLARTEALIDVNLTGAAGNITTITMTKAVFDMITSQDENGVAMFNANGQARDGSSGDDSIVIAFT